MTEDHDKESGGWSLDKRIPISLLGAILLQTIVVVIWAVNVDSRVGFLERTTVTTENYSRLDEKMNSVKGDITLMRQDLGSLKDEVRRAAVRGK